MAHPTGNMGYVAVVEGDLLNIVLEKQVLERDHRQDWANHLIRACTTSVKRVVIDVSHLPLLASTIIGALIHLADGFSGKGVEQITLRGCSDRSRRTLEMMHIDTLFVFE